MEKPVKEDKGRNVDYRAEDLVWAKNDHSRPWWPGRIFDVHSSPMVGFFGDDNRPPYSHCSPSQFLPFEKVRKVLDYEMACSCVTRPPWAGPTRSLIPVYEASEVLSIMAKLAPTAASVDISAMLEVSAVRGWLSAYRRFRGQEGVRTRRDEEGMKTMANRAHKNWA